MPIEVSFSGDEQTYEPIPKGNYSAFVNSVVMKKTEAGDQMANVRFVIADGQFTGRSLFSNFVLRDDLKWKLQNLILATGLVQPKSKGSFRLSDDWAEVIGKKLGLKVGEGEFNGELRPEVKGFFRVDGAAQAPAASATPAAGPALAQAAAPPPPSAPQGAVRRL